MHGDEIFYCPIYTMIQKDLKDFLLPSKVFLLQLVALF